MLTAAALALPLAADADRPAIAAIAATGAVFGAALSTAAPRVARMQWFEASLAGAGALVAVAIFFGGGLAIAFRFFYLWATPYAFAYLPVRRAIRHVVLAGVLSTAATALAPLRGAEAVPWADLAVVTAMTVATVLVVGLLVERISAELREADRRFRLGFESSPAGCAFLTPEGGFVSVNRAFEEIVARSEEELVGLTVFDIGHPDEHEMLVDRLQGLTSGAQSCEFEKRCVRPDGSVVSSEVAVAVIGDNGDRSLFAQVKDVTATREAEEALLHQALHDPLTGLPNRALLLDRLQTALEDRPPASTIGVMLIDLDQFKVLNDSAGHDVGDEALCTVAPRIAEAVGPSGTVARQGGDEFVVLCPDLDRPDSIGLLAVRVADAIRHPMELSHGAHILTASIGVVVAQPSSTATGLLRDADIAMYRAKARGRGRVEFFDEQAHAQAHARLWIEQELRTALAERQLVLEFQPVVEASGRRIAGFEALVRWLHPERGRVPPGEFIPVAEESGLIVDIGAWVLAEAVGTLAEWQRLGARDVRMCVNVSPRQLLDPGFTIQVGQLLRSHRLPEGAVCIEITETSLLEPGPATEHALAELRALGVTVALDDFGTGFSSMSSLHRFPIDILKVDRSFVNSIDSPGALAIVQAIVSLGRAMDKAVVAEGVETSGQFEAVAALGCPLVQGFHLSRPVSASEAEAMLGLR